MPDGKIITAADANQWHTSARVAGFYTAHIVELVGAAALGFTGGWGLGIIAVVVYTEAARRNFDQHHRVASSEWSTTHYASYADLVRNYGTANEDEQTTSRFKPYRKGRAAWSYLAGGFWCGISSRSVVPCLIRAVPGSTRKLLAWRPSGRRDPLRPDRREPRAPR